MMTPCWHKNPKVVLRCCYLPRWPHYNNVGRIHLMDIFTPLTSRPGLPFVPGVCASEEMRKCCLSRLIFLVFFVEFSQVLGAKTVTDDLYPDMNELIWRKRKFIMWSKGLCFFFSFTSWKMCIIFVFICVFSFEFHCVKPHGFYFNVKYQLSLLSVSSFSLRTQPTGGALSTLYCTGLHTPLHRQTHTHTFF